MDDFNVKTNNELLQEMEQLKSQMADIKHLEKRLKKLEVEVKQSEEKYKVLVESSEDSIFTFSKDGTCCFINKSGAELLGKSPKEIIGKNLFELFPEKLAEGYLRDIREVFETGNPLLSDESEMKIPGKEKWLNTSLIPLKDSNGRIMFVMGISRDITGRMKKRAESKQ